MTKEEAINKFQAPCKTRSERRAILDIPQTLSENVELIDRLYWMIIDQFSVIDALDNRVAVLEQKIDALVKSLGTKKNK